MDENSFLVLRKALPEHIKNRFIFKTKKGSISEITVRGLGVLSVDKQISQLIEWMTLMLSNLPRSDQ